MFKIILLTSMVTLKESYAAGDVIECENDQAWHMIDDQLGKLKGNKKPEKPQAVIDEEEKQKQLEIADVSQETKTADREIELIEREEALKVIEADLSEREAGLIEREKELEEKQLSLDENSQAK